ncbi:MAG TPA: hypothetical protein VGJ28_15155 [Micromonosporaceae bacterium]|jgi:hypothetical protein
MTALEIKPGSGDISIGPPGLTVNPDGLRTPRITPVEWARRRREEKATKRTDAVRNRALGRLHRLGEEWQFIEASSLGLGRRDAFLAIGPGGVFAVTVKSQGRSRVRLSGDVLQINGKRLDYIGEARRLGDAMSGALSRTAGKTVPVTAVLALAGSGLISVYGLPKGCVVMPYRELDNLLGAYGERISPPTVAKLASVARHPGTTVDLRSDALVSGYRWHSAEAPADKLGKRR